MLLSDGEPTGQGNPQAAYDQATALGKKGIPIFPVAFLHSGQVNQYGDKNNEQAYTFMVNTANDCLNAGGTGSQAFGLSQSNITQLQLIFRSVAHQFVTLE